MAELDYILKRKLKIKAAKDAANGDLELPSSVGKTDDFLIKWFTIFTLPLLGLVIHCDEKAQQDFKDECDAYYEKESDKYCEKILDGKIKSKLQSLIEGDDPDFDDLD